MKASSARCGRKPPPCTTKHRRQPPSASSSNPPLTARKAKPRSSSQSATKPNASAATTHVPAGVARNSRTAACASKVECRQLSIAVVRQGMDPMSAYLLNAAYLLVLVIAAPWFLFQRMFRGKYREGFAAKFLGAVPERQSAASCIWLHAVSVGEVNLLAVLLAEIAKRRPDVECVISTTSMTGYELACKKYSQHTVFYCPLDFSWALRRAMRRIRPSLLILAELELWPNLIRAAKEGGAAVAIINGRLSERSFRGYNRLHRWLRPTLARVDLVATQNEEYADRFRALGIDPAKVRVTGNLKFDGAQANRDNPRT